MSDETRGGSNETRPGATDIPALIEELREVRDGLGYDDRQLASLIQRAAAALTESQCKYAELFRDSRGLLAATRSAEARVEELTEALEAAEGALAQIASGYKPCEECGCIHEFKNGSWEAPDGHFYKQISNEAVARAALAAGKPE